DEGHRGGRWNDRGAARRARDRSCNRVARLPRKEAVHGYRPGAGAESSDRLAGCTIPGSRTLNAEQLRALQAPLKTSYVEAPERAVITLSAKGKLGDENVSCKIETGKALVEAGLHPATGGGGPPARSGAPPAQGVVASGG